MALTLPGKVQIAGIIDQAEAELVIETGADMLGFPLGLKDGREDLSIEEAATIVKNTADRVTSVCITYLDQAGDIAGLCEILGVNWVQLHGPVDRGEISKLKSQHPRLGIIKSLIVRPGDNPSLLREVHAYEALVDSFITDTFDPQTGRSGATGKTHDWQTSSMLVESTYRPVILAGGLTHENVVEAIQAVRPAAIDAHTGVEDPDGRKSRSRTTEFVHRGIAELGRLASG